MAPRTIRWVLALVCVGGVAGMIASSIAGSTGAAMTCGLVVAVASLGLILMATVLPTGPSATVALADEDLARDVESRVDALVTAGADEAGVRALVRAAVHLGRLAERRG